VLRFLVIVLLLLFAPAYVWPVDGPPHVVRGFAPPPQPWLAGHRGVDLAAPPGSPIRSAGAGVVAFAGQVAGRPVISVDHPGGLRTTYEPVQPAVAAGATVAAGAPIGVLLAGHPGCPVAACLHWGLRRGQTYLDPLSLLGAGRVRLLPLAGHLAVEQRGQALGEAVVFVRPVVDLRREPQKPTAGPGADRHLGGQLSGDPVAQRGRVLLRGGDAFG